MLTVLHLQTVKLPKQQFLRAYEQSLPQVDPVTVWTGLITDTVLTPG